MAVDIVKDAPPPNAHAFAEPDDNVVVGAVAWFDAVSL